MSNTLLGRDFPRPQDPNAAGRGSLYEAARRFDLSPLEEDFLLRHFTGGSG